jgi:ABC-type Co2+ transport system permease subunit
MHIPDGFIDGKTAAVTAVISVVGVGFALRQVRRELPPRRVPLLGLAAAFLFAAQMVNFPVAGGTSGHLVGGTLVAALLGPSAAVVVVTTVLIVQCFLFQDGGVMALGANVFNMAILNSVIGYVIYRMVLPFVGTRCPRDSRAGDGDCLCRVVRDGAGGHLLCRPTGVVGHHAVVGRVSGHGHRAHVHRRWRRLDQRAGVPGGLSRPA